MLILKKCCTFAVKLSNRCIYFGKMMAFTPIKYNKSLILR